MFSPSSLPRPPSLSLARKLISDCSIFQQAMNYQQHPQSGYVNKGTTFQTKRGGQLHHQQLEIDDDYACNNSDGTNNNNNNDNVTFSSGKSAMPKNKNSNELAYSMSGTSIASGGAKTATILVSKTKTKTGLPLLLKNSNNWIEGEMWRATYN